MKAISRLGWAAYAIALVTLAADQLIKFWVVDILNLAEAGSIPVFGPLNFTMVWNQGVSFGLMRAEHDIARWALVAMSVVVTVLLLVWARRAQYRFNAIGLGLVSGGALGNAIDRIRYGAVADFIDVKAIGFFPWIFNVADSAISIGVVCLLLDSLRKDRVT